MDIAALQTELLAEHPDTGPYSATDAIAANEINAFNRPAQASISALRNYLSLERKAGMPLMGRIEVIADAAVGSDPLGNAVTLTNEHITAAKTMLRLADPGSDFTLNLNDSRFGTLLDDLAGGAGSKAINPGDKTALQALSNNLQSRAIELGFGTVSTRRIEQARLHTG